jgi:hypothetical protein
MTGSPKRRYGYKYSDIVKVVKDILRCDPPGTENANQFAPTLAAVSRNEMQRIKDAQSVGLDTTAHPYDILADLVNKGFLTLYKPQLTASVVSGDSVQYVIFPILGTGTDTKQHSSVEVCPMPILIKLKPQSSSAIPLIVGGLVRDSSEMNLPIVVLADMNMANQHITLKVDSIMPNIGISTVELRTTDDPDFQEGFHKLALVPDLDYPRASYYVKGNDITLQPASTNTYTMKQGYSYTFNMELQTHLGKDTLDGGCKVGTVPFTISIVPSYLRWDPQDSISAQWNKHDNWMGIDEHNQPIHSTARFVPLATTAVIIPAMTDGRPYPELPDLTATSSYDSVKQVGFEYNICDRIRFLPNAAIGQQQRLEYGNAIVDMKVPQNKWAFRAAPVKGMISGDLYMANADLNNETPLWEVGEFDAAGRSHSTGNASFWLSVYNTETKKINNVGDDSTRTASADWSRVTNAMNLPLSEAKGLAIYSRTASGSDAVIRLPKDDDIYYYYGTYGERIDDKYVGNLRSKREELASPGVAGELIYHPDGEYAEYTLTNGEEDTVFVFGNPTMAYIDIWGFIADNCLVERFDFMDESPSGASVYTSISKSAALAYTDRITEPRRYLPPMRAIVLKKSAFSTSLSLMLYTNRVITNTNQVVPSFPCGVGGGSQEEALVPQRRSINPTSKGIMTVTAKNPCSPRCTSRLLIGQGYHDGIREGEDAVLTTINIDNYSGTNAPATPFNIYAAEGSYGLSIDLRNEVINIPISFYMSNLPYAATTQLWFTGVNNIDGELVLYDEQTDTERRIIDGICLSIETPSQSHLKRYYIRRMGYTPDEPEAPIATGIEPYEMDDEQAIKIIRNDQVLIIRNGQVYTVFGQKVK